MPALRELQRQFDAALRAPAAPAGPDWLTGNGLAVYRNNLRESARKALAADYPVIERLVGNACFRQLAVDYLQAQPSRSGDLQYLGDAFPRFLEARYGGSEFGYLGDVARLERALADCGFAAAAPVLSISALADIDPLQYAELRLTPHPAWRLLTSPYPVFDIWRANQDATEGDVEIDLARGAAHVIVRRADGEVLVQALSGAEFQFFHALLRGDALGVAFDLAPAAADGFDAAASLCRLFEWQLVTGLTLPRRDG